MTTSVATAIASTAGTKTPATLSTCRCTGAFDPCAAATCRTMPASSVAWPTAIASHSSGPSSLTVPANTWPPGRFATGSDSPVSIDSFTAEVPESTRPSTGTASPARTRKRSPRFSSASGTVW